MDHNPVLPALALGLGLAIYIVPIALIAWGVWWMVKVKGLLTEIRDGLKNK